MRRRLRAVVGRRICAGIHSLTFFAQTLCLPPRAPHAGYGGTACPPGQDRRNNGVPTLQPGTRSVCCPPPKRRAGNALCLTCVSAHAPVLRKASLANNSPALRAKLFVRARCTTWHRHARLLTSNLSSVGEIDLPVRCVDRREC